MHEENLYYDVFKEFIYSNTGEYRKIGDVSEEVDHIINKKIFVLKGSSLNSNFIQIPRKSKNLHKNNLFSKKYIYILTRTFPNLPFQITLEISKQNMNSNFKIIFSNSFQKINAVNNIISYPLIFDHSKWTVISINLEQILVEEVKLITEKENFLINYIYICSNILIYKIITSKIRFSYETFPKELNFRLLKGQDWNETYQWANCPVENTSNNTMDQKLLNYISQDAKHFTELEPILEDKENWNEDQEKGKYEKFDTIKIELIPEKVLGYNPSVCKKILPLVKSNSILYCTDGLIVNLELASKKYKYYIGHEESIIAFCINKKETILASGDLNNIIIWDMLANSKLNQITHKGYEIITFDISDFSKSLAIAFRSISFKVHLAFYDNLYSSNYFTHEFDLTISFIAFSKLENEFYSFGINNLTFWKFHNNILNPFSIKLKYKLCSMEYLEKKNKILLGTDNGKVLEFCTNERQLLKLHNALHYGEILSISACENYIITSSSDRALKVWLVDFSDSIIELKYNCAINYCKVMPDNISILCAKHDCSVGIFNLQNQQFLNIFHSHNKKITNLICTNSYLITCSEENKIRIYNLFDLNEISEFNSADDLPISVDCHLSEKIIAVGFKSGNLRIFSLETLKVLFDFKQFCEPLTYLKFLKQDNKLITGSESGSICIHSSENFFPFLSIECHCIYSDYTISSDQNHFLSIGENSSLINIYNTSSWTIFKSIQIFGFIIMKITMSEKSIIALSSNKNILEFSSTCFSLLREFKIDLFDIKCFKMYNDNLIMGDIISTIFLVDFNNGKIYQNIRSSTNSVANISYYNDGFVTAAGNSISFWKYPFKEGNTLNPMKLDSIKVEEEKEELKKSSKKEIKIQKPILNFIDTNEFILTKNYFSSIEAENNISNSLQNSYESFASDSIKNPLEKKENFNQNFYQIYNTTIIGYSLSSYDNLIWNRNDNIIIYPSLNKIIMICEGGKIQIVYYCTNRNVICLKSSNDFKLIIALIKKGENETFLQLMKYQERKLTELSNLLIQGSVPFVGFSQDGKNIAFSVDEKKINIMKIPKFEILSSYENDAPLIHFSIRSTVVFEICSISIDCLYLFANTHLGIENQKYKYTRNNCSLEYKFSCINSHDKYCYIGSNEGTIVIFNIDSSQYLSEVPICSNIVHSIKFSSKFIIATSQNSILKWHYFLKIKPSQILSSKPKILNFERQIYSLSTNSEITDGIVATDDGSIFYLKWENNLIIKISSCQIGIDNVTMGDNFIVTSSKNMINIWNIYTRVIVKSYITPLCLIIIYNFEKKIFIAGFVDGKIWLFNDEKFLMSIPISKFSITSICPFEPYLFISDENKSLFILLISENQVKYAEMNGFEEKIHLIDSNFTSVMISFFNNIFILGINPLNLDNLFEIESEFKVIDKYKIENCKTIINSAYSKTDLNLIYTISSELKEIYIRNISKKSFVKVINLTFIPLSISVSKNFIYLKNSGGYSKINLEDEKQNNTDLLEMKGLTTYQKILLAFNNNEIWIMEENY